MGVPKRRRGRGNRKQNEVETFKANLRESMSRMLDWMLIAFALYSIAAFLF